MFAMSPVYTEIKPARAGLTAFAAQIVEKELVREAREVVKPTSGLQLNRPVLPAPVAIVAMTSSPSRDRHIPSH